jgi:hypothetical protein
MRGHMKILSVEGPLLRLTSESRFYKPDLQNLIVQTVESKFRYNKNIRIGLGMLHEELWSDVVFANLLSVAQC